MIGTSPLTLCAFPVELSNASGAGSGTILSGSSANGRVGNLLGADLITAEERRLAAQTRRMVHKSNGS
jgi:hypothetical protein